jgi:hypothetical protein
MPSRPALGDHYGEQGNTFSELKLLGLGVVHYPYLAPSKPLFILALGAFIGMLRSDLDLDIYKLKYLHYIYLL